MRHALLFVLAALLCLTPACDETGRTDEPDTAPDTELDIGDRDTSNDDTGVEDSADDATREDVTSEDTSTEDTSTGDTTASDTTASDTTASDTTSGDTIASDTTSSDTTSGDTSGAEDTADAATDVSCDYLDLGIFIVDCGESYAYGRVWSDTAGSKACPEYVTLRGFTTDTVDEAITAASCDDACVWTPSTSVSFLHCGQRSGYIVYQSEGCDPLYEMPGGIYPSVEAWQAENPCE